MLEIIVKFILILLILLVAFQDIKERLVDWYLLPLIGLCCGYIHYENTLFELFYSSVLINLILVSIILTLIYVYARFKMKMRFNDTFGSADVLLFLAFSFSFSSVSFLIVFIFSLIFSLAIHLVLKRNKTEVTAPLAGYMSLFFGIVYLSYWSGITTALYSV